MPSPEACMREVNALLRERNAELEATLRTVRAAIIEKAECTFWLTPVETVVDHIDAVLGGFAADQAEMAI